MSQIPRKYYLAGLRGMLFAERDTTYFIEKYTITAQELRSVVRVLIQSLMQGSEEEEYRGKGAVRRIGKLRQLVDFSNLELTQMAEEVLRGAWKEEGLEGGGANKLLEEGLEVEEPEAERLVKELERRREAEAQRTMKHVIEWFLGTEIDIERIKKGGTCFYNDVEYFSTLPGEESPEVDDRLVELLTNEFDPHNGSETQLPTPLHELLRDAGVLPSN